MGERYDFTDVWTVPVDIETAWRMVDDVASWPQWWPNYRFAELVSTPPPPGVGDRWHVRVKADLPYTLDFHFTVIVHEPPTYVRTRVEGFFEGEIGWRLEQVSKGLTRLTLHEQTETKWALINPHSPPRRSQATGGGPPIGDARRREGHEGSPRRGLCSSRPRRSTARSRLGAEDLGPDTTVATAHSVAA